MDQETALNILKSGANVYLTGEAGAGKSYLLNKFISYLNENNVSYGATASTGIAATQINGQTIHTWAGIGIKDSFTQDDFLKLRRRFHVIERMQDAKVLIIDEISMLHQRQFQLVDQVLKVVRGNEEAFGGIQLVVCGDFFQLPPVGKRDERYAEKFSFMSKSWVNADFQICYLDKQYRNANGELNEILNAIRANTVTEHHFDILSKTGLNFSQKEVLKLFTHNVNVDTINESKLAKLPGESKVYHADAKGPESVVKMLRESVRCPDVLELKLNAKVMFVKNNESSGYMNGTQGIVTGFDTSKDTGKIIPIVTTTSGEVIPAEVETWEVIENERVIASYRQVPLRLAWAITIHKSQGMTLTEAEIDLKRTFEDGMGYVALSRLKDIKGLTVLGINPRALELNSLARKADVRFKELSAEHQEKWCMPEAELKKYHENAMKWYKK